MKFAFLSRHNPTEGQIEMARSKGIEMIPVGDTDAFTVSAGWIADKGEFDGVVVVHPAAAMRLAKFYKIGVFENANRAPEGQPPQFEAKSLHVYYL